MIIVQINPSFQACHQILKAKVNYNFVESVFVFFIVVFDQTHIVLVESDLTLGGKFRNLWLYFWPKILYFFAWLQCPYLFLLLFGVCCILVNFFLCLLCLDLAHFYSCINIIKINEQALTISLGILLTMADRLISSIWLFTHHIILSLRRFFSILWLQSLWLANKIDGIRF